MSNERTSCCQVDAECEHYLELDPKDIVAPDQVTLPRPIIDALLAGLRDEDPAWAKGILEGALLCCGYHHRPDGPTDESDVPLMREQLRRAGHVLDRVLLCIRSGQLAEALDELVGLRERQGGALCDW